MKNKQYILILFFVLLIPSVYSVCCPINGNCTVIETCQAGYCGDCYISIYNSSGILNESGPMGSVVTNYTYEYNVSTTFSAFGVNPYVINCTSGSYCIAGDCAIEVKQICEDVKMDTIAAIIMIPIAAAFFYLIIAWFLRAKAHWAFSIALILLAFVEFFRAYNYGIMAIAKYYNWPEMQDVIGSQVYNYAIFYGVVIAYFFIHILIVISKGIWDKNRNRVGEYGDYDESD